MAVRAFNGSSDWIDFTLPGNITGASSVLAVLEITSFTNWSSIYSHVNSAGTDGLITFEVEGTSGHSGGLSLDSNGFSEQFTNTLTSSQWSIVGYSVTGAATPTFHMSKNGAAFTHTAGGANVNIPTSQSGGKLTVGRFLSGGTGADFAAMRIAALFACIGTSISNATVDTLVGKTKTDFQAAGFTNGWEFGQDSTGTNVLDVIGSANQSAINGTSVVTGDDPPSGVYVMATALAGGYTRTFNPIPFMGGNL